MFGKRHKTRWSVRRWAVATALLLAAVLLASLPPWLIGREGSRVVSDVADVTPANVAIVFGAGITKQNKPSDVLNDRLNVAAVLYHAGKVKYLLVSGDNSVVGYSEPDVMLETLVTRYGVPAEAIRADYAGRRTYDSCIRAHDLWGIKRAVLVTQDFHLPRAIWTCRKLGIDSVGVEASLHRYIKEPHFRARERWAAYKAFIDIYLWHPEYVGGAFIEKLD